MLTLMDSYSPSTPTIGYSGAASYSNEKCPLFIIGDGTFDDENQEFYSPIEILRAAVTHRDEDAFSWDCGSDTEDGILNNSSYMSPLSGLGSKQPFQNIKNGWLPKKLSPKNSHGTLSSEDGFCFLPPLGHSWVSELMMDTSIQTETDKGSCSGSSTNAHFTKFVSSDKAESIHAVTTELSSPRLRNVEDILQFIHIGNIKEAKQILRSSPWSLNSDVRASLWPTLCGLHSSPERDDNEDYYWDLLKQIHGSAELANYYPLPHFVDDSMCMFYLLNNEGRKICQRLVNAVGYSCPDITYCPTIVAIASLLLHYLPEKQCYNCLMLLVSVNKKTPFLMQTKMVNEVGWRVLLALSRKHAKVPISYFCKTCRLEGDRLDHIFRNWHCWIFRDLGFPHIVRIMDNFFLEGVKVLYRVAMALLIQLHKTCMNSRHWVVELETNGFESTLTKFCNDIPISSEKLLKAAYGIRGLRSSDIHKVFSKTEMALIGKASQHKSASGNNLQLNKSADNLPNFQSQSNIQMMSHTLAIKELLELWSWLPARITMYQPLLLFTTEEHGCSLMTFFYRVEKYEPTIVVVKTTTNEVFGAYCAGAWIERKKKSECSSHCSYFGRGETFLFTIRPERKIYHWIGMDSNRVNMALKPSEELFMAADPSMFTIGGGNNQGLWIHRDLRYGRSDTCLTFENPPLCKAKEFEIKVLEVYGFDIT